MLTLYWVFSIIGIILATADAYQLRYPGVQKSLSLHAGLNMIVIQDSSAYQVGRKIIELSTVSISSMVIEKKFLSGNMVNLDAPTIAFFSSVLLSLSPFMMIEAKTASLLQNAAWRLCLQASLILSVFASPRMVRSNVNGREVKKTNSSYLPTLCAFLLAAIGSFLGGFLSYYLFLSPSLKPWAILRLSDPLRPVLNPKPSP